MCASQIGCDRQRVRSRLLPVSLVTPKTMDPAVILITPQFFFFAHNSPVMPMGDEFVFKLDRVTIHLSDREDNKSNAISLVYDYFYKFFYSMTINIFIPLPTECALIVFGFLQTYVHTHKHKQTNSCI